jgi:hypothetical protein
MGEFVLFRLVAMTKPANISSNIEVTTSSASIRSLHTSLEALQRESLVSLKSKDGLV